MPRSASRCRILQWMHPPPAEVKHDHVQPNVQSVIMRFLKLPAVFPRRYYRGQNVPLRPAICQYCCHARMGFDHVPQAPAVGVTTRQCMTRSHSGQLARPTPVARPIILRSGIPRREDLQHEVFSTQAERRCACADSRGCAMEVMQHDHRKWRRPRIFPRNEFRE
jgi:hypothetical protein